MRRQPALQFGCEHYGQYAGGDGGIGRIGRTVAAREVVAVDAPEVGDAVVLDRTEVVLMVRIDAALELVGVPHLAKYGGVGGAERGNTVAQVTMALLNSSELFGALPTGVTSPTNTLASAILR